MTSSSEKIALVVGASRGLGLALAQEFLRRRWQVIGTARGSARTALHETADASNGRLVVETLDMTDETAIRDLAMRLKDRPLDLLFVNAAIAHGAGDRIDRITTDDFIKVMVTNVLSPMRVVETLGHDVRPGGTIGVMSSSMGSLALNTSGTWETYRASKSALNQAMRSYAARSGEGRALALVDPGWVRTDMGGSNASLSIEESIPGVVDALVAHEGKRGLRYFNYRGETVPW